MLEDLAGTKPADGGMCRGSGTGRNKEEVDRKGHKIGWSNVKWRKSV